jgi:hypothetical protein
MVQSVGPQRLKPEPFGAQGGTAEAVPFPFLLSLYSKSRNALVAPASFDLAQDKPCRLSRGRLALGAAGEDARRTAAGTAALLSALKRDKSQQLKADG